jgi:hypothetical protein
MNDGESQESFENRRQRNLDKGINGNGMGTPLNMAVKMWPTARREDKESAGNHPGATDSLTGATREWPAPDLWRTPDAPGEGGPRNRPGSMGRGHQVTIAEQAELWQTPAVDSFRSRGGDRVNEMGLDQQARMFPTPASRDYRTPNLKPGAERGMGRKGEQFQNFVAHNWPTPTESTATLEDMEQSRYAGNRGKRSKYSDCRATRPPLRLNPRFVEWLMGFPVTWTEL